MKSITVSRSGPLKAHHFSPGFGLPAQRSTGIRSKKKEIVSLWVHKILSFSSQYNSEGWAAQNVVGKPTNYPTYGDQQGAWAQADCGPNEFIEVEFHKPLQPHAVEIYETYNPGAVYLIEAYLTDSRKYIPIWRGDPARDINEARIFSPPIERTDFVTSKLKIHLNCSGLWCEIDAIRIKGTSEPMGATIDRNGQQFPEQIAPEQGSLEADLLESFIESTENDVTIVCAENKEIPAHRLVLCSRSSVFKAKLSQTRAKHLTIGVPLISEEMMRHVLHFMYTDQLLIDEIGNELIGPLYSAGVLFDIRKLERACATEFGRRLRTETVCDALVDVAGIHDELRQVCLDFIARNPVKVVTSEQFAELPQDVVVDAARAIVWHMNP